jgi:hypothetical protein
MRYTVRSGDTVYDVAYNTTGALAAIDAILDSADIETYSPVLETGTILDFEAEIQNNAATLKAASVPFNSTYISENDLSVMIEDFITTIES